MPVKIACPTCSKNYTLPDSALGKAVKCKACGTAFRTRKPDAAAPAKPAAGPAKPGARPTKPSRPASAKPAQPVSPDPSQFGVEGGFQQQADIFGAPPSPRGGAGLGNFAEDGFGEATSPIVLGPDGGAQEVEENPFESVMTNTAIKKSGGKSGARKRTKRRSGASFDPSRYNVARLGMMIVLASGAIFLMASVFSVVANLLQIAVPSLAVVIGIVSLLISLLCLVAMLGFGLGQLICVFAPESNEKMNAGGSLGLFFLSLFGGFVGLLVVGFSAANIQQAGQLGRGPSQGEAMALGIGMLVVIVVCALLGLASIILFANYYRVIGKNIKSKELTSAGNLGLAAIGLGIVAQVVLFVIGFLIGMIGVDPGIAVFLVGGLFLGYWLAGFIVFLILLRMVMVGVRVLKA